MIRVAGVVALVLAVASAAQAEPTSRPEAGPDAAAKELAKGRFREGAEAFAAGRYKDAIDLFLDADRLAPNPAFAFNIGLAYEQIGDTPNALRWLRAYLRALPAAPDRAEIEPRIAAAEARLRARGVQQLSVLSDPPGAVVTLDGERVGITPWTGERPAGRHRATLALDGHRSVTLDLELPSDHAVDLSTRLEPADASPAPSAVRAGAPGPAGSALRPAGPAESSSASGPELLLPLLLLGGGVAGLGVAGGLEVARAGAIDDARGGTNLEGKRHYDDAVAYMTGARVAAAVGGALVAAGGVLLSLELGRGRGDAGAAVACLPDACGVTYRGRF